MIRTLFWLGLLFTSVTLMSTPAPCLATTMRYKSIRELVRGSDVTLLGQPVAQQSFWQGTRILTRVQVQVQEIWTGSAPPSSVVEVVTAGGVVGTIGQRVDGAAVLPHGNQMVLHLRRQDGEYWPVAMAQGVWVIDKTPQGSRLFRPGADRLVHGLRHGQHKEPSTLAELRAAVMEASHDAD
jgi:hypothetical protein